MGAEMETCASTPNRGAEMETCASTPNRGAEMETCASTPNKGTLEMVGLNSRGNEVQISISLDLYDAWLLANCLWKQVTYAEKHVERTKAALRGE